MTDRELLELAAKAAGLSHPDGWDWIRNPLGYNWDPLTDDGDALRLVVKLDFSSLLVWHYPEGAKSRKVWSPNCEYDKGNASEAYGTDPLAATRRAIVRAAAEIGRSMT